MEAISISAISKLIALKEKKNEINKEDIKTVYLKAKSFNRILHGIFYVRWIHEGGVGLKTTKRPPL